MSDEPHPFAKFVAILGRGKTKQRHLTLEESREAMGYPAARSLDEAAQQIRERRFAYVPLEVLSPMLRHLIDLRAIFGLRSLVHSFSRMLNPFDAPTMMQGIFHRGFMDIHAGAAQLLDQPPNTEMNIAELAQVWRGEIDDGYATASVVGSVVGTIAVTLRTMGKAASIEQAEAMASALWAARDMGFVAG